MGKQEEPDAETPLTEQWPVQGLSGFQLAAGSIFETLGCLLFGYAVCISQYYASPIRSNTGSFFVSYGLFLAIVLTSALTWAHYNLAVTVGIWLKKGSNVTLQVVICSLFSQTLGFFLGGLLCWGLQDNVNTPLQKSGQVAAQDFFAQVFGTFMFVFFVILFTSDISPVNSNIGKMFIIPFVLFIFRTWAFRTQSLNPTLALGLGLVDGIRTEQDWEYWQYSWVVIAGPLLGGFLAPLFFDNFYRRFYLQMQKINQG